MNQKFIQRVLATLERIATSGTSRELKRVPLLKKILEEAQELESIRASKVKGAQLRPPWAPPREPFAGRLGLFGGKMKAPPAKEINPFRTLTSFRDRSAGIAAENARKARDAKILKGGVDVRGAEDAIFLPSNNLAQAAEAELIAGTGLRRLNPARLEGDNEPAKNLGALFKAADDPVFSQDLSRTPPEFIAKALRQDNAKRLRNEWPVKIPQSKGVPYEEVLRDKRLASAAKFEAKGETIKAAFVRRSLRQDDLLAAMETGQKEPKLPVRPWKGGLNRNRTEMALGPESHKVNGLDHKVKGLEQALKEAVSEGVSPTEAGEDAAAVLFRFASGQDDARRVETLGKMTLAELGQKAPFLSELLAKQVREKGLASGNEGVRTFLRNTGRADPRQINVLQVVRALAAGKGHGEQTKMLKGVLVKPGGGFPLYKYADDRNLNAPGSEALREIARQKKMERVSASQVIPGERVLMEKRRASLLALKQKKAVGLTKEERDHLQRLQREMKSVDSKEVSAPTPSFVKKARATPIPYGGL